MSRVMKLMPVLPGVRDGLSQSEAQRRGLRHGDTLTHPGSELQQDLRLVGVDHHGGHGG